MLANRVREFTVTTGTGNIALGGAITGHIRFADAFVAGDRVIYVIEDGDNYEIGTATLLDADTLERTDVAETLVEGFLTKENPTAIHLSGQARVFSAVTAEFLLTGDVVTSRISEADTGSGVIFDGALGVGIGTNVDTRINALASTEDNHSRVFRALNLDSSLATCLTLCGLRSEGTDILFHVNGVSETHRFASDGGAVFIGPVSHNVGNNASRLFGADF